MKLDNFRLNTYICTVYLLNKKLHFYEKLKLLSFLKLNTNIKNINFGSGYLNIISNIIYLLRKTEQKYLYLNYNKNIFFVNIHDFLIFLA